MSELQQYEKLVRSALEFVYRLILSFRGPFEASYFLRFMKQVYRKEVLPLDDFEMKFQESLSVTPVLEGLKL